MAWEWSHTPEAYSNAYENLHDLPHDELAIIWAEWHASRRNKHTGNFTFRSGRYDKNLAYAQKLPDDILADSIWERAEQHATCDNGGFDAWVCPYGCHTVSFDREESKTD